VRTMLPEREELTQVGDRLQLYQASEPLRTATFADDVRSGLTAREKRLAPKYLYDDLGSTLFEAICLLPEYYLTRAETEILTRDAGAMIESFGVPLELVELGSGSAQKTRILIEEVLRRQAHLSYHPIDISPGALIASASGLIRQFDRLSVTAYASDYFDVLANVRLRTSQRVLALFLGSNVGNYEPQRASELLRTLSSAFRPGDGLLLGVDLKKDPRVLELAYNDPTGVTAAFNKNLLGRINRELGGTFDQRTFSHVAHYDAEKGSVDSFLVAGHAHRVSIESLDLTVSFAQGEAIHTESSHKFSSSDVAAMAAASGFIVRGEWRDAAQRFSVALLVVP
jgi:L-histidine N-alpha-methyltransferase